jgi:hypothetical protein
MGTPACWSAPKKNKPAFAIINSPRNVLIRKSSFVWLSGRCVVQRSQNAGQGEIQSDRQHGRHNQRDALAPLPPKPKAKACDATQAVFGERKACFSLSEIFSSG